MVAIFMLIAGLALLTLSGDALVRGSVAAAERMHIPSVIIGLTIVAFGTSAPELIVSIEAAFAGAPGLALGNAVGSNIANILLVLGLPAIFSPILLHDTGIRRSSLFMIMVSALLVFLALDGDISRWEGIGLIALLGAYLVYSGVEASKARNRTLEATLAQTSASAEFKTWQIICLIVFGIAGLGIGGMLTTDGALALAAMLGVADSAVGLTIVALGTSLPELTTSLAAAFRKQAAVAIGNVIGSNIFNILGIVGITATLVPLSVSSAIVDFDIWFMLATAAAIVPIAFVTQRINRIEGVVMTIAYIVFTIIVFQHGIA